jgi:hypothetical protein
MSNENDDYDYNRYEKILQKLLDYMIRDPEYLTIGENISDVSDVKIMFDGYGDIDEEEYIEGGNKNMESYCIFIHKDAGIQDDFEFPEHDVSPWCLIHRPDEEVCIYAWYDVVNDDWSINSLEETSDHAMTNREVMDILVRLSERYDLEYNEDEE